jgi:catechol 2,3-dioxygenase-like lactoylglutathione lyase family enzyme
MGGICRIEEARFGVEDVGECVRFFTDFGLEPVDATASGATFATPAGQRLELRAADDPTLPRALEDGSTVREVIWGVDEPSALEDLGERLAADREVQADADGTLRFRDETGYAIGLRLARPVPVTVAHRATNATGAVGRLNQPLARLGRAHPIRICHVALNIPREGRERAVAFYVDRLGFRVTDDLLDMGAFMQCPGDADQHNLLLGHRADRVGINHLAYEVANFDEVVEGGNHMVACGWKEARRLGRHTVGSNVFRFFHAPCGGRVEYAADMDRVDERYGPNVYEQRPPHHMWMLTTNGQKEEL